METMRSWMCEELNGEQGLALSEAPVPVCGPGQILVRNHFTALNFPDALMIRGLYQMKVDPPFVPGSELAGEILALGEGVEGFSVGQRVLALTGVSACSEQVLVTPPMQQLHAIPDSMDFKDAAAFNMTYGTSMHALKQRGALQAGETLLVLGSAGGCGSAAVQIGKAMGATVIAGASSEEKCAAAKAMGADHAVNYREQDLRESINALTDNQGVDVVYDPVGDSLFDQAIRCVGWNGRYLVVGFAGGNIPTMRANYTILKSIAMIGVAYGMSAIKDPAMNNENFAQLFSWYQQGKVKPMVGKCYSVEQFPDAMAELYAGQAIGKTVIDFAAA